MSPEDGPGGGAPGGPPRIIAPVFQTIVNAMSWIRQPSPVRVSIASYHPPARALLGGARLGGAVSGY